jgi:hypothetical protein
MSAADWRAAASPGHDHPVKFVIIIVLVIIVLVLIGRMSSGGGKRQ